VNTRSNRGRSLSEIEAYLNVHSLKICVEPPNPRKYRYVWRLSWDHMKPPLMVVGLIPSTADEAHADPTVWKCITIASANSYGALIVVNMFARWPTPNHFERALTCRELTGPENDRHISEKAKDVRRTTGGRIVAAWGDDGWSRHADVLSLLCDEVWCFGTTNRGFPSHAALRGITAHQVTLQRFP
jgi:hypothetical protein